MENQNQNQTLILIGVAAVAAYFLFFKNKEGMEDIIMRKKSGKKYEKKIDIPWHSITKFT
jgi:hypothetical protein